MDPVDLTLPETEVAEAKRSGSGMKRPKKLVKGSAATKRWMTHLRSMRKSSKKAKTPARGRKASRKGRKASPKARKTPARRSRKGRKTPARKVSRKGRKTPARKTSRKGRKSSPKRK